VTETSRYVAYSPALAWLLEHPEVGVAARQAAGRPGEAFADAVLADPSRLVDLHRAVVVESLASGTPAGATDELIRIFRHVEARAAEPSTARQALLPVVAPLKGLRDRHEIVPALRAAADKVTDLPTRERVLELADFVSHEPTLKREGRFGQVAVELPIPSEPTPDPGPSGPVRPKTPAGKPPGEPVVPVVVQGSPELELLDQAATAGSEAAVEWAKEAGYPTKDAAPAGERYATEVALEIMYGGIGEGSVGASRCLLAEVLARVGFLVGYGPGRESGWAFGSDACESPTPHGVDTAIRDFAQAMQGEPVNELTTVSMVACVVCDFCVPCMVADLILLRS